MSAGQGEGPEDLIEPRRWWQNKWAVRTTLAVVLIGAGGGLYLAGAGAAGTTSTPTKGAIEGAVLTAANVSQSLFSSPVTTSGSLHMADAVGDVQQNVSANSQPWVLCPSARGVTLSTAGSQTMASYNRGQITAYFTGVQEQQELQRLARHLTGTTTPAKISSAQQRGCSTSSPPNWTIIGPSITSVAQWSSVVQTGTTATVSVVLLFDEVTCTVTSTPNASGTYGVTCPAPKSPSDGGTPVSVTLQKGADGEWRIDDMIIDGSGQ